MAFLKRIFLFLAMNFLVMVTLSFIINFFGLYPRLTEAGFDYPQLIGFCLVWGMGGAFISLLMSRILAKWMMGVQLIDPQTRDPREQEYLQMVYSLARSAGLTTMPQVGVYNSPEINAFATGPSRSRSLVAVSSGLLDRMRPDEVEGVVGHEIAHIANGDMVTMTLIQGVVNAFVMALARIVAFALMQLLRSRDDDSRGFSGLAYGLTVFVLEMVFMILASIFIVFPFSRWREFRADAGGARLAGREKMVAALQALKRNFEMQDPHSHAPAFQSMKISTTRKGGIAALFATHPSLDERITRLETATNF